MRFFVKYQGSVKYHGNQEGILLFLHGFLFETGETIDHIIFVYVLLKFPKPLESHAADSRFVEKKHHLVVNYQDPDHSALNHAVEIPCPLFVDLPLLNKIICFIRPDVRRIYQHRRCKQQFYSSCHNYVPIGVRLRSLKIPPAPPFVKLTMSHKFLLDTGGAGMLSSFPCWFAVNTLQTKLSVK